MTTANAHKAIKPTIFTTAAEFLDAVRSIAAEHVPHMGEAVVSCMLSNFPQMQTADGPADVFGWTEADNELGAAPVFAEGFKPGSLAIVPIYGEEAAERAEGKPLALPSAIYLLNLPTIAQVGSAEKLRAFFNEIARAALKTSASRIAKAHSADPEKAPMLSDPVAMLLASLRPARKENAFKRMAPVTREMIIAAGKKRAEALKAAGQTAKATAVLAVFDRRQFTPDALEQALSSTAAAAQLFPRLPAEFWVKVLDSMITHAPNMKKEITVKDSDGNTITDDAGKPVKESVSAPVNPALFMGWKETRDETPFTTPASLAVDFSDMTL